MSARSVATSGHLGETDVLRFLQDCIPDYNYDFFAAMGHVTMLVVADLEAKHLHWPGTYFATIPRDIIGIIREYVRCGWSYRIGWDTVPVPGGTEKTFYTLGVEHATDHPSHIRATDSANIWFWRQYGVMHSRPHPTARFIYSTSPGITYHWTHNQTYEISNSPCSVKVETDEGYVTTTMDWELMWQLCCDYDPIPLPEWYKPK